jgi:drug/metabolite transporter (DMT)-like permease
MSAMAATSVRYFFAWPLVALWCAGQTLGGGALPLPDIETALWCATVAVAQIAGTWFLLRALESRNFAAGVAYSKTDTIQAAVFEAAVLGAALSWGAAAGIAVATCGVVMLSLKASRNPLAALAEGLMQPSALFGLASGASFAVAGVAVRGAVTSFEDANTLGAGASALMLVLSIQIVLMTAFLSLRERASFTAIGHAWRPAVFAGVCGAASSVCWFVALGLQSVAMVRTLGLVEVVFTIAISRLFFNERVTRFELLAISVLLAGIAILLNAG